MDYVLLGHDYEHAAQTCVQVFFPNEGYKRLEAIPNQGPAVVSGLEADKFYAVAVKDGEVKSRCERPLTGRDKKAMTQCLALAIYDALSEYTGYRPPWGTLTGVRPAKIITERVSKGLSYESAKDYLVNSYAVSGSKAELCVKVAMAEERFVAESRPGDTGIYIGIPFCPTRCRYCSFVSYPLDKHGGLREAYLEALFKELDYLGEACKTRSVKAVYVGGGTPTALEEDMLDRLLGRITKNFGSVAEITVEAGRPDSVTAGKLNVLKSHGTTRIAVNPQTMSAETLVRIGRSHTPEEFLRAYELADSMGFDNINCDLIMGLPGETPKDAENTMGVLERLKPASITVHTLAMKRAAEFNQTVGRYGDESLAQDGVTEMLEISKRSCEGMGLKPHYMYRQKNMVGNFENVGYAKDGFECVYNLQTMTEAQSVLAAGAGAVTKVLYPETNFIKRAFNLKDIMSYINNVDNMIDRKRKLLED